MTRSRHRWRRYPPGPELCLGPGSLSALPDLLPPERYLIVSDPGLSAAGQVAKLSRILDSAAMEHCVFDRVRVDPDILVVEEACAVAREEGCGGLIGLGGGSSLDAAKAVAARLAWPDTLRSYGDGKEVPPPLPPFFAVPSTAGTGSEATRVAVITDPERREKMAIRGEALLPSGAVLDPELLATLPPRVAAACGADALTHAIEAYVSRQADPWSDCLALGAIELIGRFLPRLVAQPADLEAGERMLLASHLAGRAFTQAGLGLVHSLAEPLGAFHHVEHGVGCALFLPIVMEFNLPAARERYARVARALEAKRSDSAAAIEVVRELLAAIGLPTSYREAGIEFELIPAMLAQVIPQSSTRCNPRQADPAELEQLFRSLED